MRIIALLDTSIASMNKGDSIIMESVKREIGEYFKDDFVLDLPTHTVAFPPLKSAKWSRAKAARGASLKIVCGTDIFWPNMLQRPNPLWNISLLNYRPLRGALLCGVGMNSKKHKDRINLYSRALWKRVLSPDLIHSTRDEKTKRMLQGLGLKAVNTGCPTLWMLTPEHCAQIPTLKASHVVTALSDKRNPAADQALLTLLQAKYENVYLWIQGHEDYSYARKLVGFEQLHVVAPHIEAYSDLLSTVDVDYVGPRLHAGIYALQHKRRAVVLGVDHRASTWSEEFNVPYLERSNLSDIETWIESPQTISITCDFQAISDWKLQLL